MRVTERIIEGRLTPMRRLFLVAALLIPVAAGAQVPVGSISGQILTREGKPAAAVRVSAMAVPEAGVPPNGGTALVSLAMTDSEGRYRLENVVPGRYYVMAGFVDLPSYYPGVAATSNATVIEVLSGTPVTGINFGVANTLGVTVSGRVRRATGTGVVVGQRVALIGGHAIQETTTTADGSFQLQRVRPGTYQLQAAASVAGRLPERLPVVVGAQDVSGLELVVVPALEVAGNVVIEGKGPVPRIQLQFSPYKGGQNSGVASSPDGSFRTVLAEGDYRISWANLPAGYEVQSMTSGTSDLLATPLKISADARPEPIRFVVSVEGNPWVKVSGRVTNAGSTRTLTLAGPGVEPIQLTLNPDGTFEIPQALPGIYQLRPALGATLPMTVMPLGAGPMTSVVIPNQDTTDLIIPLTPTKDIVGIVVNSNGAGIQDRLTMSYSQTSGTGSSSGTRTFITPPDGRFSLQAPENTEVRLSFSVPGTSIKSVTYGTTDLLREALRVTAAETAEIRVVLDTTSTTIAGGTAGVVMGAGGSFSLGAVSSAPPPTQTSPAPSPSAVNRISEELARANLASSVPADYPALARAARVQANVVLQVEISLQGRVQNVSVVSGHPLLNDAAMQAVRQWTYKPFVLNGQTVPVTTTVTVPFSLR